VANSFDVIVVGLGAMGSATTCHLAARGARVLGVDRFTPPHDNGSSHGESRIIRELYYEHPLYVPLVQRAYDRWEALEHDAGVEGLLNITGGLMIGRPDGALVLGARRAAVEHGLPIIELGPADLRRRYPQFTVPQGLDVLLDERAGYLDPEACVRAHLKLAARNGASLRFEELVLDWRLVGDGVEVKTSRGTYTAERLVISAGAWTRDLLGEHSPPLALERQVLLWFDPPGEARQWSPDRFPIYMCEWAGGPLVYGFPKLHRGWKAAVHYQGEPVPDAGRLRRTVDAADIARVRQAVARLFPWAAHAAVRESAVCLYTNTPDLHFVIDFLPGDDRVLVSSPCSGHGFKFASAIGELQAQLLLDGATPFDLTPFRLDRFA
jgi:sarcosine oxidase